MHEFLENALYHLTGPYPEPYLIVSSRKEVAIVDLTSVYKKSIVHRRSAISKSAIDPFQKLLYFQDGTRIYQSNLGGSNTSSVSRDFDIWAFAFDWWGKRLFWVQSKRKSIITVGSINFQHSRVFVDHKEDILSLAVDPSYG